MLYMNGNVKREKKNRVMESSGSQLILHSFCGSSFEGETKRHKRD